MTTFQRYPLRWFVLTGVLFLSFTAFIERLTTSIVAERMMPELGLTQVEMGWLFDAFAVGYTAFQFPGGLFGLHYGARRVLALTALVGAAASIATAAVPMIAVGTTVLAVLLGSRLLLGIAQAPLYPVSSGALEVWFPSEQWAWIQGLVVTSLGLGAAITPPALAWMMQVVGWKLGVLIATVPGVLAAVFWWRYARDQPYADQAVTDSPAILVARSTPASSSLWRDAFALAVNRDVLALTLSYLLENSVVYLLTFWSFLYLVQERHFSALEGGWLAGVPFIVGAFAAAVGGRWCDRCCQRFGPRWGVRLVPLVALPAAAAFLYLTVRAANPYVAVGALTASYSCLQMTEGPYWSTAMRLGQERTMAATGILNTGGNLGGVITTPIVGYLSGLHNWTMCFALGAVCIIASTGLWFFVHPELERSGPRITDPIP